MSDKTLDKLESLLEQSLPDLVRKENTQRWTEHWIGQTIESYVIEELVGTGTHGIVFRAHRTTPFERTVAIKLLPDLRGQAEATRFQNECQALADLEHPNISQILTAGLTEDDTPYLVMPLLQGVPIDDYIEAHGQDWLRIAELMRQLAEAVAFAHGNGVVHCDLKPDNILVDDDGRVTVTDFGLAVRIDEMADLAQRPSWAPGTIGYAAPEILSSRKDASPAVDIYSLGAVLYRLLTGEAPHQASGWLDGLVATVEQQPKPVQSREPSVPDELAQICDRCLAKKPEHRLASAAELESQLGSFLQGRPNSPPARPRRSLLSSLIALTALACAIALPIVIENGQAGAWLGWNQSSEVVPDSLSDQQVDWILRGIEEQLLRPGLKDPAEPGDFEATFATLKDAARELDSLLAHAPNHKEVRHRAATGYFLLGRAAHWAHEGDYADRSLARSEQMFRALNEDYPDDGFLFDFFHTIIVQATRAPPRQRVALHRRALEVIEELRETKPLNLDYADAHACMLVCLADDYTASNFPNSVDLERALAYANRAKDLAEWTCRQPGSLPLHRKHIMTSSSCLSEIARHQGDFEESLKLAEVAQLEAIRLDDALQIADTKHQRFDKTLKVATALCNVGGLESASAAAEEAQELARQLRELGWPETHVSELRLVRVRDLICALQQ